MIIIYFTNFIINNIKMTEDSVTGSEVRRRINPFTLSLGQLKEFKLDLLKKIKNEDKIISQIEKTIEQRKNNLQKVKQGQSMSLGKSGKDDLTNKEIVKRAKFDLKSSQERLGRAIEDKDVNRGTLKDVVEEIGKRRENKLTKKIKKKDKVEKKKEQGFTKVAKKIFSPKKSFSSRFSFSPKRSSKVQPVNNFNERFDFN